MDVAPGYDVGQKHGSHVSGSCQNGHSVTWMMAHQEYEHMLGLLFY